MYNNMVGEWLNYSHIKAICQQQLIGLPACCVRIKWFHLSFQSFGIGFGIGQCNWYMIMCMWLNMNVACEHFLHLLQLQNKIIFHLHRNAKTRLPVVVDNYVFGLKRLLSFTQLDARLSTISHHYSIKWLLCYICKMELNFFVSAGTVKSRHLLTTYHTVDKKKKQKYWATLLSTWGTWYMKRCQTR